MPPTLFVSRFFPYTSRYCAPPYTSLITHPRSPSPTSPSTSPLCSIPFLTTYPYIPILHPHPFNLPYPQLIPSLTLLHLALHFAFCPSAFHPSIPHISTLPFPSHSPPSSPSSSRPISSTHPILPPSHSLPAPCPVHILPSVYHHASVRAHIYPATNAQLARITTHPRHTSHPHPHTNSSGA